MSKEDKGEKQSDKPIIPEFPKLGTSKILKTPGLFESNDPLPEKSIFQSNFGKKDLQPPPLTGTPLLSIPAVLKASASKLKGNPGFLNETGSQEIHSIGSPLEGAEVSSLFGQTSDERKKFNQTPIFGDSMNEKRSSPIGTSGTLSQQEGPS